MHQKKKENVNDYQIFRLSYQFWPIKNYNGNVFPLYQEQILRSHMFLLLLFVYMNYVCISPGFSSFFVLSFPYIHYLLCDQGLRVLTVAPAQYAISRQLCSQWPKLRSA